MDRKTARHNRGHIHRPCPEHPAKERPVMRHLPIVRPLAALVTACLMTTQFASSQAPIAGATAPAPTGAPAVQPESTPEALSAAVVGKTFYLRGFYQDDKLEFATDGKPVGSPQRGSFALSAVEIDKVKFTKHSMQIEAHRLGLHFFGALPYEDDTKPFERIKVDPKKSLNIEVDRLVIEPEKKKKKKDEKKDDKKDAKEIAAKPATATDVAEKDDDDSFPAAPSTAAGAKAAPGSTAETAGAEPAIAP